MPKMADEMQAIDLRRITKRGHHPVGGVPGLLLRVSATGGKSWILRVTVGTKRRDIGLGGYPGVSLAQARQRAREVREAVWRGADPVADRDAARAALAARQAKSITFDEAVRRFLATKTKELHNAKHSAQWGTTLATYASPIIGQLPVDAVELPHILQTLEPIWLTKTETAKRLRGRIESVLSWATVSGFRRGDNPARWRGNLDVVLQSPGKVSKVAHHRALPWKEMPQFMAALRGVGGMGARALELAILTGARSGEVRGATWCEIDADAGVWAIPGERMKAGRTHTVPLSPDAVELLGALPRFAGGNLVFTAARGGQLSDMTLSAVLRRMGAGAVPHGFRSTFRDWCAEATAYPHEVAEMALAHSVGTAVERAYRRGDLLEKRRRLMDDWARFCRHGAPAGDVVPIRGRA